MSYDDAVTELVGAAQAARNVISAVVNENKGRTVEGLREIGDCLDAAIAGAPERDEELHAALAQIADAMRLLGGADPNAHRHVVTFDNEGGYGLNHPLKCRPNLLTCPVQRELAADPGRLRAAAPGTLYVELTGLGALQFERITDRERGPGATEPATPGWARLLWYAADSACAWCGGMWAMRRPLHHIGCELVASLDAIEQSIRDFNKPSGGD